MYISSFQADFNFAFYTFIENEITKAQSLCGEEFSISGFDQLRELIKDGKRVRPYMCAMSYVAHGGKDLAGIQDILLAVELIHLFALIHDDVMDQAPKRRGVATIHAQYRQDMPEQAQTLVPESVAILVGDLVYTWALSLYYSASARTQQTDAVLKTMLTQVILGQMKDVKLFGRLQVTRDDLRHKNFLKTTSYSFIQPLNLGMRLASETVTAEHAQNLEAFATHLGEAFQTQDDYLDVAPSGTKNTCSDISSGVPTVLSTHVLEAGVNSDFDFLQTVFGKSLSDEEKIKVIELMEQSGAHQFAITHFTREYDSALRMLTEDLGFATIHQAYFDDFIRLLMSRSQ